MFPDAQFITASSDAPALPGAYVLMIELQQLLVVTLPNHSRHVLEPGRYLYCGSARVPGACVRGCRATCTARSRSAGTSIASPKPTASMPKSSAGLATVGRQRMDDIKHPPELMTIHRDAMWVSAQSVHVMLRRDDVAAAVAKFGELFGLDGSEAPRERETG